MQCDCNASSWGRVGGFHVSFYKGQGHKAVRGRSRNSVQLVGNISGGDGEKAHFVWELDPFQLCEGG